MALFRRAMLAAYIGKSEKWNGRAFASFPFTGGLTISTPTRDTLRNTLCVLLVLRA